MRADADRDGSVEPGRGDLAVHGPCETSGKDVRPCSDVNEEIKGGGGERGGHHHSPLPSVASARTFLPCAVHPGHHLTSSCPLARLLPSGGRRLKLSASRAEKVRTVAAFL